MEGIVASPVLSQNQRVLNYLAKTNNITSKMKILKTTTADSNFLQLEKLLDAELRSEYPDTIDEYQPYNKFKAPIKSIIILKENQAIACGAMKELGDHVEIKRMFVHPDHRRQGHSRTILLELEQWAKSLEYQYAILETGKKLFKPISLYQSTGYQIIPNYGPYINLKDSVCMKKKL